MSQEHCSTCTVVALQVAGHVDRQSWTTWIHERLNHADRQMACPYQDFVHKYKTHICSVHIKISSTNTSENRGHTKGQNLKSHIIGWHQPMILISKSSLRHTTKKNSSSHSFIARHREALKLLEPINPFVRPAYNHSAVERHLCTTCNQNISDMHKKRKLK